MRTVILLLALLVSGCAASQNVNLDSRALPAPSSLRAPAEVEPPGDTNYLIAGSGANDKFGVDEFGNVHVAPGGMAWATFYVPSEFITDTIYADVLWKNAANDQRAQPQRCFMAIANMGSDQWEFLGEQDGEGEARYLDDLPGQYVSQDGEYCWLAVLVTEPGDWFLFNVRVGPDPLPAPWGAP
jgi:hypothetical protein